jgi:oligopeptidase B
MNRILSFSLIALAACRNTEPPVVVEAPVAKKVKHVFREQGLERTDPYLWLSKPEDTAVIAHLKRENAYVDAMLKHTEPVQKELYDEMVSRFEQKSESLPVRRNGYWYYQRYAEGSEYPMYCRRKGDMSAPEEVMLDVNAMAKGYQIYLVRGSAVSSDNRWLAYAVDTSGDRRCLIRFRDLTTGKESGETLSNGSGSLEWADDGATLFYIVNDHTVRPYRLLRHRLGGEPSKDELLYTERDSTFELSVVKSASDRYIFLQSWSTTSTEARYMDARLPDAKPVLMQARQKDVLYYPDHSEGDTFHIINNLRARNFKLSSSPTSKPGMEAWKDVLPHRDSALLESAYVLHNHIVAQYKKNGLTAIDVTDRRSGAAHTVDFGEEAYVAYLQLPTDDIASDSIRYLYSSLTTPETYYGYNLRSRERKTLKQQKVGGGYKASDYETQRLWATATDGTRVPVTVSYRKDRMKKDGSNPLLLYAYGSYGYSTDPWFDPSIISLMDRGITYAIAHVRGGQEMGRYWYEDGKLLKKKNTFTDFIACAEHLVSEGYTKKDRLFANGGSAGGMLMGAVTNMRPDLFRGVIAEVPWMDVVTDMYNTDLPLTTLEFSEWGDPRNREYHDYMMSWSPYDNVTERAYPEILATGGLNDTQVPYFSPAKWVQKVRENNTASTKVLFKCNMGAGHGGESGRFESQRLTALKYAWMLDVLKRKG